ncbi:MAG: hypothetical protein Q4G27_00570 [Flavobacteriaceae bacterium]|nr:hypothetical protein [Flavobacteriaceae bacterium]
MERIARKCVGIDKKPHTGLEEWKSLYVDFLYACACGLGVTAGNAAQKIIKSLNAMVCRQQN